MFDNAIYNSLKKRVDPYLEPGEDLLSLDPPRKYSRWVVKSSEPL